MIVKPFKKTVTPAMVPQSTKTL